MSSDTLYVHSEDFKLYDFGPRHPFSPVRQEATDSLVRALGLFAARRINQIEPASDALLQLVHSADYLDAVKVCGGPDWKTFPRFGLGTEDNPPFPDMHWAAAIRVGATLAAVQSVAIGEATHALNLGGGLHHAHRERASGFCVYNDIAVAIAWLRREYGWRVAYVDIDAHHGDGVQAHFYDDPAVLTISLHQSGHTLFPGTGDIAELGAAKARGTSVNLPFAPGTQDESWLSGFERVVPGLIRAFRPDIIVSQHGVDAHRLDPLTHLELTTSALETAARRLHELAHEVCHGRWVALGGGGYSIWQVVPRAWAALAAVLDHATLPAALPEAWRTHWASKAPEPLPVAMHDEPGPTEDPTVAAANRNTVSALLRLLGAS